MGCDCELRKGRVQKARALFSARLLLLGRRRHSVALVTPDGALRGRWWWYGYEVLPVDGLRCALTLWVWKEDANGEKFIGHDG